MLEGNIRAPPNGELAMLEPKGMLINPISPLDPMPPWYTGKTLGIGQSLDSLGLAHSIITKTTVIHDIGNKPLGLSPLDIQWGIPKDGICLFELFEGINFGLVAIL